MEYTIYNESLIYYALRNSEGYLSLNGKVLELQRNMKNIVYFNSIQEAKEQLEEFKEDFPNLQIRKVKIIDIGEIEL